MLTEAAKGEIKNWIEKVSGVNFSASNDIAKSLKDGIALCKLIEKVKDLKNAFYHKQPGNTLFKQMENAAFFMNHCKSFGVTVPWHVKILQTANVEPVLLTIVEVYKKCLEKKLPNIPPLDLSVVEFDSHDTNKRDISQEDCLSTEKQLQEQERILYSEEQMIEMLTTMCSDFSFINIERISVVAEALREREEEWINRFVERKGVDYIAKILSIILEDTYKSVHKVAVQEQCIHALKILTDYDAGVAGLVASSECFRCLYFSGVDISAKNFLPYQSRSRAFIVLSVMITADSEALYSLLEAVQVYKTHTKETTRFHDLVCSLDIIKPTQQEESIGIKLEKDYIASIVLINSMLSACPEENIKSLLLKDLLALDLVKRIVTLQSCFPENEVLKIQVDALMVQLKLEHIDTTISSKSHHQHSSNNTSSIDTIRSICSVLDSKLSATSAGPMLERVLNALLLVSTDISQNKQENIAVNWHILEKLIMATISGAENGLVDDLLEKLTRLQHKIESQDFSYKELSKKLETVVGVFATSKVEDKKKIEKLQEEVDMLQRKVSMLEREKAASSVSNKIL